MHSQCSPFCALRTCTLGKCHSPVAWSVERGAWKGRQPLFTLRHRARARVSNQPGKEGKLIEKAGVCVQCAVCVLPVSVACEWLGRERRSGTARPPPDHQCPPPVTSAILTHTHRPFFSFFTLLPSLRGLTKKTHSLTHETRNETKHPPRNIRAPRLHSPRHLPSSRTMTKPQIAVFLPIFFSALVICAVVLCTCMYCHRPNFLGFGGRGRGSGSGGGGGGGAGGRGDGSDYTSSSDSSTDLEKGPDGRRRVTERVVVCLSPLPFPEDIRRCEC